MPFDLDVRPSLMNFWNFWKWLIFGEANPNDLICVEKLSSSVPPALKKLEIWANYSLCDGLAIEYQLEENVFGVKKSCAIMRTDIKALATLQQLNDQHIALYMIYLHTQLVTNRMDENIKFVAPSEVEKFGSGNHNDKSCRILASLFEKSKESTFLLPYNRGGHWALVVVKPSEGRCYYLDSLYNRLPADDLTMIVQNGIKMVNAQHKKCRNAVQWKVLMGVPKQDDVVQCGFYVMRYMKEILEDMEGMYVDKWMKRSGLKYNIDDINVVRADWANFFQQTYC